MALVLKMQIDDKQEHQYIFSTGDDGTIELIPLNVVINGTYQAPEGKAYNLVTVEVPEITLEQLNVQTSGTYTAPSGKAYDVVTVDIPEYVLDALTATENGTFEPESGHVYNRVVVNVPPTAPDIQTKSVTYTANGTYIVNKDTGYDGMSSVTVTVNVPTPTPNLQIKNVTVTQNGTSAIIADSGYDGLEEVDLTVNVPTPTPNLQTKNVTVTQNGTSTITADTGYDGLEEVGLTVNVPTGGGGDDIYEFDFTPENNATEVETITLPDKGKYPKGVVATIKDNTAYPTNLGCIAVATAFKTLPDVAPNYASTGQSSSGLLAKAYRASSQITQAAVHADNMYYRSSTPSTSTSGRWCIFVNDTSLRVQVMISSNTSTSASGLYGNKTYHFKVYY